MSLFHVVKFTQAKLEGLANVPKCEVDPAQNYIAAGFIVVGVRIHGKHANALVPGFDICELMPMQAQLADKLALVRTYSLSSQCSMNFRNAIAATEGGGSALLWLHY